MPSLTERPSAALTPRWLERPSCLAISAARQARSGSVRMIWRVRSSAPAVPLDAGLTALAQVAAAQAALPLEDLCRTLADAHLGDGRDDIAVLALRTPPAGPTHGTPVTHSRAR
ncbi:hypothetical protein HS99_0014755 [Kitasatospora aureofaciens]|uniref:Uncharacterized protein n=2 Tax=Kitasatospora aureofaciens TaxID=1894 RepID=A0A1E7MXF2_KITAU|nr:hypothetical protein HS99_0014755 [Kitasatospora aureofaciens]